MERLEKHKVFSKELGIFVVPYDIAIQELTESTLQFQKGLETITQLVEQANNQVSKISEIL